MLLGIPILHRHHLLTPPRIPTFLQVSFQLPALPTLLPDLNGVEALDPNVIPSATVPCVAWGAPSPWEPSSGNTTAHLGSSQVLQTCTVPSQAAPRTIPSTQLRLCSVWGHTQSLLKTPQVPRCLILTTFTCRIVCGVPEAHLQQAAQVLQRCGGVQSSVGACASGLPGAGQ